MSKTLKMIFVFMLFVPVAAMAKLNVFACEPEWAALVGEIGGDAVSVRSATTGLQDPHHIQARPSLIARARRAKLVVCTGAELEIGWLPLLLRQASNPAVQPGQRGYFEASQYVRMQEVPTHIDRAQGDVHPYGNPHIQTDPRNFLPIADALTERLAELDPDHAADYRARHAQFSEKWKKAILKWKSMAEPLRGMPVVVYHKSWVYLENWLGLREIGTLEPKPGVPPSAGHLARLLVAQKHDPAKLVMYASFQDPQPGKWFSEKASVPAVELPLTVGGVDGADDLFGLFDQIISRLLAGTDTHG